jgi:Na+/phosphate symporter
MPVTLGHAAEAIIGLGLILISTKILTEHTMPL